MKPESYPNVDYHLESETDAEKIDLLYEDVFGEERLTRAAHKVREGAAPDPKLCFVARQDDGLVGSVRLTPIRIGKGNGYLLGPLCVLPGLQGHGIGRCLVRLAVEEVERLNPLPVFLVGDEPYYGPLGFEKAPAGVKMPSWVDYDRVLVNWPKGRATSDLYHGMMKAVPLF